MSTKNVNVVVTGVAGRMGKEIARLVRAADGLTLSGATEQPGPAVGKDAGLVAGLGVEVGVKVQPDLAAALPGADVVVDFTLPEASVAHAKLCAERGVAIVIGSTGLSAEAKAEIDAAAKRIPVVLSPNMSVGVNVLFELVRQAAKLLGPGFDVEIVELHHKHKRDAPSGTAVRLAEVAAEALGRTPAEAFCFAREGITGERPPWQIGVQTLRGGDVVGEHTVLFVGEGERVELVHRATTRVQFATGAVRAAAWLPGKPAGRYDMADVLGLRK
ncbi:MAG TPA: 4-hydroxy-tetrahydrodipicolinate reductase [Anaeromyxobacter sp.]|nr:4-hydroxy-tetrahydrodipicolinate reductase [Anaeromyxobacter sp.]